MLTRRSSRQIILALCLLFGVAMVIFTIIPINRLSLGTRTLSHSPALIERAAITHLAAHIILFGALTAGGWFAAETKTGKSIALMLTMLLGCGTEYLEHYLYRSPLELNDISTNLISSLSVFSMLTLIHYFREKSRS